MIEHFLFLPNSEEIQICREKKSCGLKKIEFQNSNIAYEIIHISNHYLQHNDNWKQGSENFLSF